MTTQLAISFTKSGLPLAASYAILNRFSSVQKDRMQVDIAVYVITLTALSICNFGLDSKLFTFFPPLNSIEKNIRSRVYTTLAGAATVTIIASQIYLDSSIKRIPSPWKSVAFYETITLISFHIFAFALKNIFSNCTYLKSLNKKMRLLENNPNSLDTARIALLKLEIACSNRILVSLGTPYVIAAPCISLLGQCFLEKIGFTAFYPNLFSLTAGLNRELLKYKIIISIVELISDAILNLIFNTLAPPAQPNQQPPIEKQDPPTE